jgi:hypothetical protein
MPRKCEVKGGRIHLLAGATMLSREEGRRKMKQVIVAQVG